MSGNINKPNKATYYIASENGVDHYGITEPNQVTSSGLAQLDTTVMQNQYLGMLNSISTDFPALPEAGTPLFEGEIYSWNGKAVMVRQDHVRSEHAPDIVPALFLMHRTDDSIDWIAGERVHVGTERIYNGLTYECIQMHVTQADWTPDVTPALWALGGGSGGGETGGWIDTGATVTGQAGQLYYISVDVSAIGLSVNQKIKLGNTETKFVKVWPGTTNLIQIAPYVAASVGAKLWKFV